MKTMPITGRPWLSARRLRRALVAAMVALLSLSAAPSQAGDVLSGDEDQDELPDQIRIIFPLERGRFAPTSLVLIGPNAAIAAALPRWAEPADEERLPLSQIGVIGQIFEERPLTSRIDRSTRLGALYRAGDALTAVFESEGAYRDALWRLEREIGIVTRPPRDSRIVSLRLALDFTPVDRAGAAASLQGPIGDAHGAGPDLVLAPPLRRLPHLF